MQRLIFPALAISAITPSCKVNHEQLDDNNEKPNVIIVLTDDQGYGDFSVHGNPYLKTPNLDKLHSESIRLTDFHVAPMCAPTRAQLITGVDCMKHGCYCTSMGLSTPYENIPFVSEIFKDAGYSTGLFGKWHMGYNYPHRPMDRGFDEVIYFKGFGLTGMGHHWNSDYYDPFYYRNGELEQGKGYCNDIWFEEAMGWIKKQQDAEQPFFCMIPTNLPHGPEWVDTVYSLQFKGSGAKDFYGMIANVDENVGKLDKFLKENGLRENTILIYTTDNGTIHSEVFNAGMKQGKCSRFDGGHRVPCFISWPNGNLAKPTDIETPTQVQDLTPTLIDLCEISTPDNAKFSGISIVPLLKGGSIEDRMFVVQYQQNNLAKYDAAVIWNNWRLIMSWGDQLFDIKADPHQDSVISENHPEVMKKMRDFYEQWWAEVEPGLDKIEHSHIGTNAQPEVILNASDWMDVRADGNGNCREAAARPLSGTEFIGGIWHINVKSEGEYQIELRRYPREADAPICGEIPAFVPRFGKPEPAGVAVNASKAFLETANGIQSANLADTDKAIYFKAHLKEGQTKIRAWFGNNETDYACGAYYAYVKKLD